MLILCVGGVLRRDDVSMRTGRETELKVYHLQYKKKSKAHSQRDKTVNDGMCDQQTSENPGVQGHLLESSSH